MRHYEDDQVGAAMSDPVDEGMSSAEEGSIGDYSTEEVDTDHDTG